MSLTYEELEKENFDLQQLLEISRSLSSKLDRSSLLDAILYICMGQMRVTQAALFARDNLDSQQLIMTRNQEGFVLDHCTEYKIDINDPLANQLAQSSRCIPMDHCKTENTPAYTIIQRLNPSLIIPLAARGMLMGLILLGERIDGSPYSEKEQSYLMDIARLASTALYNAILFEMSTTDMMTHLKFRHYFTTVLSDKLKERGEALRFSLIMMDIDHFKRVNDTYGHKAGDEVIIAVSNIILENLRHLDMGVRYGGEEFLIYLEDIGEEAAFQIAERLRIKIGSCRDEKMACTEQVSISAGVASYNPSIDQNIEACVHRADIALYHSKHHGRNRSSRSSEIA